MYNNKLIIKSKNILQNLYQEERYECDSLANPIQGTWVKFQELYTYHS